MPDTKYQYGKRSHKIQKLQTQKTNKAAIRALKKG
jgi:hypothetical protein